MRLEGKVSEVEGVRTLCLPVMMTFMLSSCIVLWIVETRNANMNQLGFRARHDHQVEAESLEYPQVDNFLHTKHILHLSSASDHSTPPTCPPSAPAHPSSSGASKTSNPSQTG